MQCKCFYHFIHIPIVREYTTVSAAKWNTWLQNRCARYFMRCFPDIYMYIVSICVYRYIIYVYFEQNNIWLYAEIQVYYFIYICMYNLLYTYTVLYIHIYMLCIYTVCNCASTFNAGSEKYIETEMDFIILY